MIPPAGSTNPGLFVAKVVGGSALLIGVGLVFCRRGWLAVGAGDAGALDPGAWFSPFLGFRGGKAVASTFGAWTAVTVPFGPFVMALSLLMFYKLQTVSGWATLAAWRCLLAFLLIAGASLPMLAVLGGHRCNPGLEHRARPAPDAGAPSRHQKAVRTMIFIALGAAVSIVLLGMAGITLSNLPLFPRLRLCGSAIRRPQCARPRMGVNNSRGLSCCSGSTGQVP